MDLGVKLTGSGFPVGRRWLGFNGRLCLTSWLKQQSGYAEFQVPHLVNEDRTRNRLVARQEAQMYEATLDGLYLIPTAEVPLTNLYRDALLSEQDLPLRLMGYTLVFAEGGLIW